MVFTTSWDIWKFKITKTLSSVSYIEGLIRIDFFKLNFSPLCLDKSRFRKSSTMFAGDGVEYLACAGSHSDHG